MKKLSQIAMNIQPSATLAVDSKAKALKAEGKPVLNFGIGEPDFDTPEAIKAVGIEAIQGGKTKYTPAAGTVDVRKAAAYRLKKDCGLDYDYTQIVIASGAKHVIFAALQVLVEAGDEVILPAPYWVSYLEMIRMAGGTPVVVDAPEAQDFKITPAQLESAITPRTKALILNSPSNPTGMVYTRGELAALAEVCRRHDLYVVSDEIYNRLVYDGTEFTSFASLSEDAKERTIVVNGASKTYAMTGWRIGYAAANADIAKRMSSYLSHSTGAPATMCQAAAAEAFLGHDDTVEQMRKAFEQRRRYLIERISAIDGVSCLEPQGAFYVMLNIEKLVGKTIGGRLIADDGDFCEAFLEKSFVALTPGKAFGIANFARWSYAASMENIEQGCDRLEAFLKS